MLVRTIGTMMIAGVMMTASSAASADVFELMTGVAPSTSPGGPRAVFPSSFPGSGVPGTFVDGQRLGGTPSAAPTSYAGTGTPFFDTNEFGSLSYMFRRGSVPTPVGQGPVLVVDYLGGPLLDLDGDPAAPRSLVPVPGQTPVTIPGSQSFVDLSFDSSGGIVGLNNFDVSANNGGFEGFGPEIAATVNTIAGTQPDTSQTGPINPSVDTRTGALSATGMAQVSRIENLGYEFWQDSISESSTSDTLGTLQYLGSLNGYLIERDGDGDFPTLAGAGLGTTLWPSVDTSRVGDSFNTTLDAPFDMATILDGVVGDTFSDPGNGGLALTDFGGDLGAYLDSVVLPAVDPLSSSVVYLESAGFGINNSFDPVFSDTVGYDVVLIAQSQPIPEPVAGILLATGALLALRRRVRP